MYSVSGTLIEIDNKPAWYFLPIGLITAFVTLVLLFGILMIVFAIDGSKELSITIGIILLVGIPCFVLVAIGVKLIGFLAHKYKEKSDRARKESTETITFYTSHSWAEEPKKLVVLPNAVRLYAKLNGETLSVSNISYDVLEKSVWVGFGMKKLFKVTADDAQDFYTWLLAADFNVIRTLDGINYEEAMEYYEEQIADGNKYTR